MSDMFFYNRYSEYLQNKYGEKVYKLPINLPITCPNRIGSSGCVFCAEVGTGFESLNSKLSVTEQLITTQQHIREKYKAHKYIAYFQNYTNTFMPIDVFHNYLIEAASVEDIVEISISTRPDCIKDSYLDILEEIRDRFKVNITIELGLQTVNYHTLDIIERGHGLAEFIDAVMRIKKHSFSICTHVILNLPQDTMRDTIETAKIISALNVDIVKLHSLYIAKNTKLCEQYKNGTITICTKDEYLERVIRFLEYLSPTTVVERLFSRIPEADAEFSNWGISWWKLHDELLQKMRENESYQGKLYDYLNGSALKKL